MHIPNRLQTSVGELGEIVQQDHSINSKDVQFKGPFTCLHLRIDITNQYVKSCSKRAFSPDLEKHDKKLIS